MVGQIISHYRVISKLGEGGMGVVHLAEDIHYLMTEPTGGRRRNPAGFESF